LPCNRVSMLSGVSLSQWRSTMLTPALFTKTSRRFKLVRMYGEQRPPEDLAAAR
jgi:hypothetical protein